MNIDRAITELSESFADSEVLSRRKNEKLS